MFCFRFEGNSRNLWGLMADGLFLIWGLPTITTKDMNIQLFTKVHYKCIHLRQETNEKYYWETECKHYRKKEKQVKNSMIIILFLKSINTVYINSKRKDCTSIYQNINKSFLVMGRWGYKNFYSLF